MPPTSHFVIPTAVLAGAMALDAAAQLDPNTVPVDTLVRFETDAGDITVGLFDSTTPLTVANFLNYVTDGDYEDAFFHRLVQGFVIQGGLATLDGNLIVNVPTDPSVQNEPFVSNTLGTIAMAKLGGDPDSATSQFFFSLDDNSGNLDNQNGGFTAFGRIVDGLDDFLVGVAALDVGDASNTLGSAYTDLPVEDFDVGLTVENLVSFSVTVLGDLNNDAVVELADLNLLGANQGIGTTAAEGDIDGDDDVDFDDIEAWLGLFGTVTGDINLDQSVNTADLAILAGSFGSNVTSYDEGDLNLDGIVNTADLAILAGTFGNGPAQNLTATATIPEPATGGVIAGLLLLAAKRRR